MTGGIAGGTGEAALGSVRPADSRGLVSQPGESWAGKGGVTGLDGGGETLRRPAVVCWSACREGILLGLGASGCAAAGAMWRLSCLRLTAATSSAWKSAPAQHLAH